MTRFTEKVTELDIWKYKLKLNKDFRLDNVKNGLELYGKAVNKLAEYEDAEENGLLVGLPCKVGQVLFVDTNTLPTDKMEFDGVMPAFQKARVVSIRINSKGMFIKVAVKAKFLEEWVDYETGPESGYFEKIKYFVYPKSALGKTIFLTMEEAEKGGRKCR